LAAGLRPDQLWELERSPRPPSRKTGDLLLRGGEGREGDRMGGEGRGQKRRVWGREGRGKEGGEGRGGEGKEGGRCPPNADSWIRPWSHWFSVYLWTLVWPLVYNHPNAGRLYMTVITACNRYIGVCHPYRAERVCSLTVVRVEVSVWGL